MKEYTGKTVDACLTKASEELGIEKEKLTYEVIEERKGLFIKKATIQVCEFVDVVYYAEDYLKKVCAALGLEVSLKSLAKDEIIKILIETNENKLLIGYKGETLQSLNDLVKLAVSNKFKRKYRILLDIHNYKDKRYNIVIKNAKFAAREVLKTHVDVKLDPMTPDERKKVHTALSTMKNIKTESVGDGKDRAIVIKYVKEENEAPVTTPTSEEE